MSIRSSPYPADGVQNCPTVCVAQSAIRSAFVVDGAAAISQFGDFLDWRVTENGRLPSIKSGYGINKLRRPIGWLWGRMSVRAKAIFLAAQYTAAVDYLNECLSNIQDELGEIEDEVSLPSADRLLSQWLVGEATA
jgi:hypothetical protein